MSGVSQLQWALYEGVHQPALVVPAEELVGTDLPAGFTAVYLLGLDSTVMVPNADVSEYDPTDTAKVNHPAAALGVATAQQILEGFQGDSAAAAGADADDLEDEEDRDEEGASAFDLYADQRAVKDTAADDDEDEHDDREDAEARRRRREEKKQRKEEKKKAKEAKKAAKAAVKREREEITSAPAIRRRHGSSDDDSNDDSGNDDDDALLFASAIEKKYGANSSSSSKKKAAADVEEESRDTKTKADKKKSKQSAAGDASWAALEEDLFSESGEDEDEEANGFATSRQQKQQQQQRSLRSGGNRMGQALAALTATSAMNDIPGLSSSCPYAHPYLMEIHFEYEQLAQEATNEGLLLNLQKAEVIREIDNELKHKAAERVFLAAALDSRQRQQRSSASTSVTESEMQALEEAIEKLDAPLSVAETVRRLVSKQMPSSATGFDRAAATRARRAVQRRTRTFQDTSVVTLVDQLRSADAAPREDGAEVMRQYIQQRRQHEELKSNFRGLSKTGFHAVSKPLEKWKRERDMMLLANVGAEAQRVRPTSYISQAYSTMRQRMKEHAEKKYDRMAVAARAGSSFLDTSSFAGAGGASSPAVEEAEGLSPMAQQQLMGRQQQHRLMASNTIPRHEAFFQFHSLRCDTEAPVTLETVTLNAGFGGANGDTTHSLMSQNVMPSMGDDGVLANSAAPESGYGGNNTGNEASMRSEDGLSQQYSTHSAAPSSYPYLFDQEPRARRPSSSHGGHAHRHRSSMSGYSSEGGADEASRRSSRASSVGSAYSEQEGNEKPSSRRHRNGGTSTAAAAADAATANTVDWRSNAKRSLMEQLTLYRRGRGGKPAILSDEECREIGRTLLERAMRAEAERQGLSLAVQSNNIAAPFTKITEQRLKKSVDHYLERRMTQKNRPILPSSSGVSGAVLGNGYANGGGAGVLPMAPAGEAVLSYDNAAVARQRAVADTPVYES